MKPEEIIIQLTAIKAQYESIYQRLEAKKVWKENLSAKAMSLADIQEKLDALDAAITELKKS